MSVTRLGSSLNGVDEQYFNGNRTYYRILREDYWVGFMKSITGLV